MGLFRKKQQTGACMALIRVPQYAQFSKKKRKIYELAVQKLRLNLAQGFTYDQACDTLSDLDAEMRAFVRDDFLKILIAEEHFGAGLELTDLALFLNLSCEQIESAALSLLNDMVREADEHQRKERKRAH